jgi:hypothetical protein
LLEYIEENAIAEFIETLKEVSKWNQTGLLASMRTTKAKHSPISSKP